MVTLESLYDANLAKMDRLENMVNHIVDEVQKNRYWVGEKTTLTWGEVLESLLDKEHELTVSLHEVYLENSHSGLWLMIDETLRKLATERAEQEL